MYSATEGIWKGPDPLAEKDYSVSPYAYCLNNPVRFIDPDGKKIVDIKGTPITYSEKTGWSSNVTPDVMKIGNAMMLTPTGKEQLSLLMQTEVPITMVYDPGFRSDGNELGTATLISDPQGKVVKAEMTIYGGRIEENVNNYNIVSEGKATFRDNNSVDERRNVLLQNLPTVTERIGQTAVHEGEHILNPNAQSRLVGKENAEKAAIEKEIKAIKETPVFNREIPTPTLIIKF